MVIKNKINDGFTDVVCYFNTANNINLCIINYDDSQRFYINGILKRVRCYLERNLEYDDYYYSKDLIKRVANYYVKNGCCIKSKDLVYTYYLKHQTISKVEFFIELAKINVKAGEI